VTPAQLVAYWSAPVAWGYAAAYIPGPFLREYQQQYYEQYVVSGHGGDILTPVMVDVPDDNPTTGYYVDPLGNQYAPNQAFAPTDDAGNPIYSGLTTAQIEADYGSRAVLDKFLYYSRGNADFIRSTLAYAGFGGNPDDLATRVRANNGQYAPWMLAWNSGSSNTYPVGQNLPAIMDQILQASGTGVHLTAAAIQAGQAAAVNYGAWIARNASGVAFNAWKEGVLPAALIILAAVMGPETLSAGDVSTTATAGAGTGAESGTSFIPIADDAGMIPDLTGTVMDTGANVVTGSSGLTAEEADLMTAAQSSTPVAITGADGTIITSSADAGFSLQDAATLANQAKSAYGWITAAGSVFKLINPAAPPASVAAQVAARQAQAAQNAALASGSNPLSNPSIQAAGGLLLLLLLLKG
jgi:hypothetical protein